MTPQELKNSILQRAFTGKLTYQDKNEYVEKSKIDDRKNKNIKEFEFDLPNNWVLSTIEGVSKTISTKKYQIKQTEVLSDGEFPVISQSNKFITGYYNDLNKVYKNKESVVIFGDHTTVAKYIDFDFVVGADGVKIFEPNTVVDAKYLYYVLSYITIGLDKLGRYSRHYKFIKDEAIPIPPLVEQKRIVEKIEELMPLVDEYEENWQKLEEFNQRFPEDMKKSLLQEAIKGKLVEQRKEEGTGTELFDKIQKEKKELIKEGKIKNQKPLPEITEDEIPFEIPETWKWVRLGEIIDFQNGYAFKSTSYVSKSKNQVIRLGNVKQSQLLTDVKPVYISDDLVKNVENYKIKQNDILVTMTGTRRKKDYFFVVLITKDDVLDKKLFLNQRVGCFRLSKLIDRKYILKVLQSNPIRDIIFEKETGTANQGNLGSEDMKMYTFIPLPPLAEQKRIVDRLEELLPLCDKLIKNIEK